MFDVCDEFECIVEYFEGFVDEVGLMLCVDG